MFTDRTLTDLGLLDQRGLWPLRGDAMKRTVGLAALALVTVAGLAPATALSPQRASASTGTPAVTGTGAAGGTKLWAATYRDHVQLNSAQAVVASPDGSTVFITGTVFDPF